MQLGRKESNTRVYHDLIKGICQVRSNLALILFFLPQRIAALQSQDSISFMNSVAIMISHPKHHDSSLGYDRHYNIRW